MSAVRNVPSAIVPETERPLRDVVRELFEASAKLNAYDDEIHRKLLLIENHVRAWQFQGQPRDLRPVSVDFPPWGRLAWSTPGRGRSWRLIVIEEDEVTPLLEMPRECRADACSRLEALLARIGIEPDKNREPRNELLRLPDSRNRRWHRRRAR